MGDDYVLRGRNDKYDIQLSEAKVWERRLHHIFTDRVIEKRGLWFELKTEQVQWEQTGNIFVEWADNGRPSGIMTTESDYWVHQLTRGGRTLVYLMHPIDRMRELERHYRALGRYRVNAGDNKRMSGTLIPLKDILR